MRTSIVFLIVSILSCGGSSGTPGGDGGAGAGGDQTAGPHGCTHVQGSCTANMGRSCSELAGFDDASAANFRANCQHATEVWSAESCDKTGTVGGCETAVQGTCAAIWSFAPVTTADVQAGCVGQYEMFVTP